ncbi:hypothetical protein [Spirochaeta dissipatitropha]
MKKLPIILLAVLMLAGTATAYEISYQALEGSRFPESSQQSQVESFLESLEMIVPSSVLVVERELGIELLLVPESFVYEGTDFTRNLPAGLQFFANGEIEFDFRMRVAEFFLRISGRWFSERQLAETMYRALQNPQAFLQSQDPEILFQRMIEQERVSAAQLARIYELQEETAALRDEAQSLRDEALDLRDELQGQLDYLSRMQSYLQETVIVEHNRGFFGGLRVPDVDMVMRARELKTADPGLDARNLRDMLREEGFSASDREAALILSVFFNEHS